MKKIPHIVIVGGGAGGLELAVLLGKRLAKKKQAQVTLVDKSLTHLWKPLLHEVAAGTLDSHEDELNYLAHAARNYYDFQLGTLEGLNRSEKRIQLGAVLNDRGQEIVPGRSITYDILVVAVGSVSNDFGIPGVQEHCLFLDNRQQADFFHQQFLKNLIHAQTQSMPLIPGQLDIAIVGGGATGVELAAELHYTVKQAISYGLDRIDLKKDVKLTLIEAADRILAQLPTSLSTAVSKELTSMNVKVLTNERVAKVTADGLYTGKGLYIPALMKVWAAGIKCSEVLSHLDGLACNKLNQLIVKQTLQTTNDDAIFALGDCASCPQAGTPLSVPPRAQAAHQQAKLLAKSLTRLLAEKSLLDYTYRDYGSLISLSHQGALGNLMGRITGSFMIEGRLARLVYLSLYKSHQIALHGSWRVILLSLADFLTRRIKPRLKLH